MANGLEIALAHAARGREVFPFRLGHGAGGRLTKTPLVRWTQAATTDEEEIRAWYARWPDASCGWRLPEGAVVADLDDVDAFEATGLELPDTAWQATPSGGRHHLYEGVGARQTVKEVAGLDTRVGGKGWVGLYSVDSFAGPVATAPAPAWLLMDRPERETRDEGAPMGTRSEILSFVGSLRASGADRDDILSALERRLADGRIASLDEARPWTSADMRVIAREAAKWAPAPRFTLTLNPVRSAEAGALIPEGVDGADLLDMDLPPPTFAFVDLIPSGTSILAAAPKIGKSWLCYQACAEVALGGSLLGHESVPGSALYYALEDGPGRAQSRLRKVLGGRELPRGRLELRWDAPKIGKGLEDEMAAWLDAHDDARLVVLDTLQRARPASSGRRGAYEVDVEDLSRLQNVFKDRPVALLVVHHTRKLAADDLMQQVSGTFGTTGTGDTTLVLNRKRLQEDGVLTVMTRQQSAAGGSFEAEIAVSFKDGRWTASMVPRAVTSPLKQAIHAWLLEHGPAHATEIHESGIGESRVSVQQALAKLLADGAVDLIAGRGYVAVMSDGMPVAVRPRDRDTLR